MVMVCNIDRVDRVAYYVLYLEQDK